MANYQRAEYWLQLARKDIINKLAQGEERSDMYLLLAVEMLLDELKSEAKT